ncbi:MAG TPA: hypothetical protein PKW21_10040 [Rhabdaerophilum sp.]|nr:hypothetical protein [Rhabdaerophilum sp.]
MKSSRSPSDNPVSLSRRAFCGALPVLSCTIVPARAAPLRRVSVNVALEGVGAIAAHVRRTLPGHLARELSRNPIDGYPPGARLVVRVTQVYLSAGLEQYGGFGNVDALDGEAMILDAAGNVLLRKSVAGRAQPETDVVSAPFDEPRRVEALIRTFAYWTVRSLQ